MSAHTLRYYERAGLMLESVDRAASTHRRYSEDDIRWVDAADEAAGHGDADPDDPRLRGPRAGRGGQRGGAPGAAPAHRESVLVQLDEIRRNLEAIDHKIEIYSERCSS